MTQKIKVILLEFEQPSELTWDEILIFAEDWNSKKETKLSNKNASELSAYFENEDDKELKELETILEQKHEEKKWNWARRITKKQTKKDLEGQDFIQIIGDGYADEFLMNESNALSPMERCESCGTIHSHLRPQKKALQVNETFLDKNGYPNDQYKPRGLDIINIEHGALLVSKKAVELITEDKKFYGYRFLDVINQKGKVSDRLYQLVAEKVILLPDNLPSEDAICPTCGTVLKTLSEGFNIRKERLEGASFFSRVPSGVSSIYISNSLYHLLKSENIRGLTPVQGAASIND